MLAKQITVSWSGHTHTGTKTQHSEIDVSSPDILEAILADWYDIHNVKVAGKCTPFRSVPHLLTTVRQHLEMPMANQITEVKTLNDKVLTEYIRLLKLQGYNPSLLGTRIVFEGDIPKQSVIDATYHKAFHCAMER